MISEARIDEDIRIRYSAIRPLFEDFQILPLNRWGTVQSCDVCRCNRSGIAGPYFIDLSHSFLAIRSHYLDQNNFDKPLGLS